MVFVSGDPHTASGLNRVYIWIKLWRTRCDASWEGLRVKSFVGVTIVQRLEFSFVVQEIDVLGAPKLIRFLRTV